jgi:hypothetical protein
MAAQRGFSKTEPPRRRRGFEPASKLALGQMRKPLEKRGFSDTKLITHWVEFVGQEIAVMAAPVKVRFSPNGLGATLVLLTTGSHAPILEMQKEQIRQRVNACYGYNAISKIVLTQTAPSGFAEGQAQFYAAPKPKKLPDAKIVQAAQQAASKVADPDLKAALERLAENILTKNMS